MGDFLIIAGQYGNLLERATLTSSSADPLNPLSYLVLGPWKPFRFTVAGPDNTITANLALITNGSFTDDFTSWIAWNSGAGNVSSIDTVTYDTAPKAAKFTIASSGYSWQTQTITVRSGARYNFYAALRGDGTIYSRMGLGCDETGLYLQTNGTWGAFYTWKTNVAAWSVHSCYNFAMPSFADCGRDLLTLRLLAGAQETGPTGNAWVDTITFYPSWDTCALHGVELGPVNVEVRKSVDAFATNDDLVGTMTKKSPTMYYRASSFQTARHMRFKFVGTDSKITEIGTALVGQSTVMPRRWNPGHDVKLTDSAIVEATPGGVTVVTTESRKWPARTMRFDMKQLASQIDTQVLELFVRSRGATYPIWIVPNTAFDDYLHRPLLGRIDRTYGTSVPNPKIWPSDKIVVTELPFAPKDTT